MPIKGSWGKKLTRPTCSCFADDNPNVLGTLFHLQSEVQACRHYQIRVGIPDGNLGVESSDIQLGGRKCLLSCLHAPSKASYLCFVQSDGVNKRLSCEKQVETRSRERSYVRELK